MHTPPADTWQDWVDKFGVDPDQVRGMESEDLAWMRAGEGRGALPRPGPWPFGIPPYAGREDNDLVLWLPSINAIVSPATRSPTSATDWASSWAVASTSTRDDVAERLRPLLELPVELVLPAHGEPADRAALESGSARRRDGVGASSRGRRRETTCETPSPPIVTP